MTTQILFTNKQDFIDALKARRPELVKQDREAMAKHKAAEKEALERLRARCQEVAKMPYAEAKAYSEAHYGDMVEWRPPSCPTAVVPQVDRLLAALALSAQEKFTVVEKGSWGLAFALLAPKESVECGGEA